MSDTNFLKTEYADILKMEGVSEKGYGRIPKAVMIDTDLSLEAKAIYSYFASYSGAGLTSFPGRDKILSDLNIGRERYYKHLNLLISYGYIKVEQVRTEGNHFSNNLYTLVLIPEKYLLDENKERYPGIVSHGIQDLGYGTIPKAVMLDPRLNIKEKGLYSYFCSFKGERGSVHPSRENILYHLGISHDTYTKCKKNLSLLNFITVNQRHENGKLGVCEIYINENPDLEQVDDSSHVIQVIQCPKNQYTVNRYSGESLENTNKSSNYNGFIDHQYPKNQHTENENMENQYTENRDTINNNKKINNLKNNKTKKRDSARETSSEMFLYKSFAGELELPKEEYDKLADHYQKLDKLLDKAICSLALRNSQPKSMFHFICEIAMNANWEMKEENDNNRATEKTAEEKVIEQWDREEEIQTQERVRQYMLENNIEDYEYAYEQYLKEVKEKALKKYGNWLK